MKRLLTALRPYWPYGLITLLIMAPLLTSGYILTLDLVFTPHLPRPTVLDHNYLWETALHLTNLVIPSQLLEKLLLIAILLLGSIGLHRLLQVIDKSAKADAAIYVAGLFYSINPFTYSRFMAGQLAVLLAYALLPWFIKLLYDFGRQPNYPKALRLGLLAWIITTISVHAAGELGLIIVMGLTVMVWQRRAKLPKWRSYWRPLALVVGILVVGHGFWLLPNLLGRGSTAQTIANFNDQDLTAFATLGGNTLGRIINILHLQGFWAEAHRLYWLPQDLVPAWGLLSTVLLLVLLYGGRQLQRKRPAWAMFLLGLMLLALGLASGLANPLLQLGWLRGFREPHKFVGLMALVYSLLLAYGLRAINQRLGRRYLQCGVLGLSLVFVGLFTWPMIWGFHGQLKPRQYPSDWYAIDRQLSNDSNNFKVLFLPWHQYMSFEFSGRIIANPANKFFARPVIVSNDPEFGGSASAISSPEAQAVDSLLKSPPTADFAERLAKYRIKYVLLASELDYKKYQPVVNQPHLQLIRHTPTLWLYQNRAWKEGN